MTDFDMKAGCSESEKSNAESHSLRKPYVCDICNARCYDKRDLIIHKRNHKSAKPFICRLCCTKYISKRSLVRHIVSGACVNRRSDVTLLTPNKCKYCNETVEQYENYISHLKSHYAFECSTCTRKFNTDAELISHVHSRHKKQHLSNSVTQSDVCNIYTYDICASIKCNFCSKTFPSKQRLKMHFRYHTGEMPFTCIICNKGCYNRKALRNHEAVHGIGLKEKIFECNICKRKFAHIRTLQVHMRIHSGEVSRCHVCNKNILVTNFEMHALNCKEKVKLKETFNCSVCCQTYDSKDKLDYHLIHFQHVIKSGSKIYQCNLCNMKFESKYLNYVHYLSHKRAKTQYVGF